MFSRTISNERASRSGIRGVAWGRDDHVRELPQWARDRKGFRHDHVEAGAAEPAAAHGVDQGMFVDDAAPADIHEERPGRQRVEFAGAHGMAAAVVEPGRDHEHVDPGEDVDETITARLGVDLVERGVALAVLAPVSDHVHPQRATAPRDLGAGMTGADDAHATAEQRASRVEITNAPHTPALGTRQARGLLAKREHEIQRVFREGRCRAAGRVVTIIRSSSAAGA